MTARIFADDAPDFISRDSAAVQAHVAGLIQRSIRFEPLGTSGFEARVIGRNLSQSQFVGAELPAGLRFFSQAPQDNLTVLLIEAGAVSFQTGTSRIDCAAGNALAINTATTDHGAYCPGTRVSAFTIRTAEIAQRLEALFGHPPAKRLEICAAFAPATGEGATIASLMATAAAGLRGEAPLAQCPRAARMLQDALVTMVLESFPHNYSDQFERKTPEATPWQIRRAVDYIAEHAHEALTVTDVAAAVGIGLRSLQQGFRRYRQTSPHDYIKAAKLSGVRDELLNPDSRRSIEDVARHWGFANRGHFATEYRRVYGELPSETRRSR